MRILTVTADFPAPHDPQMGVFILRQLQAIAARGHEVSVFRVVPLAPPMRPAWRAYHAIPSEYEFEGVHVRTIRAIVPPRRIALEYVRHQVSGPLRKEIERVKPDVLHAHYLLPGGTFACGLGTPVVVTAHGSDAYDWAWQRPGLRRAAQRVVTLADRVVAVSDFIKECVRRLGGSDVPVVYNGADDSVFAPADKAKAQAALGLEPGRPVVAYAGHLIPTKGVRELAKAMVLLADLRPILCVAGVGPESAAMMDDLRAGGIDHRFFGVVGQKDVARIFAAADVVTLPSYEEGLPVVVCEAMLAGRAVVATPVGGIPEIVRDGVTGRIVGVRDVEALAAALREVVTSSGVRRSYEDKAREFAVLHLTWRANAAAYEEIYRTATARGAGVLARAR